MDLHVSLPWELEEDILSRLPLHSLIRFRAVSKRWNSYLKDKSFIKKHLSLSRPQFIFLTKSSIYSIDIDQRVTLRELHSSCSRDLILQCETNITTCDDLLFCKYPFYSRKVTALWNPWLRQVNWINLHEKFRVAGLGYDSSRLQKVYKLLLYHLHTRVAAIYECASHVLRYIKTPHEEHIIPEIDRRRRPHVSLNGNLYSIARNLQTCECFIECFDFTREIFKTVCRLPSQDYRWLDELILAVCKGDRFSFLKQCYVTKKIEIWVMENKIDDKEEVVWVNLMTLTASNLPKLLDKTYGVSYFIYDKTLFICCGDDGSSQPCIYIVKGDVCNKIQIGYGKVGWFSHCAYVPNLTSVPLEF